MQGDDQLNEFLSSFEFIQPPSKVKLDTGSICIYILYIYRFLFRFRIIDFRYL